MDVSAALANVARLGPFFTVGPDAGERDDPAWHPVAELYAGDGALGERIAHVRRVLGSDDRVTASIAFQSIAALLVSAPLSDGRRAKLRFRGDRYGRRVHSSRIVEELA